MTKLRDGGYYVTIAGGLGTVRAGRHQNSFINSATNLDNVKVGSLERSRASFLRAQAFNYPYFPRFLSIFSRFPLDFWPCSLDSWRPDAENGRKMGENG